MDSLFNRLVPILGIAFMVLICLAVSTDRRAALRRWQLLVWSFALQLLFALLILRTAAGRIVFDWLNTAFVAIIDCTYAGTDFLFGALATPPGPDNLATVRYVDSVVGEGPPVLNDGFSFAFYALSVIVFFSALVSILYHMGVLQRIVAGMAAFLQKTLHTSGAETLSAAGNIFLGMLEAPLLIKPYLQRMTRSELMTVMTAGFATVAGSVMAAYVGILTGVIDSPAGHLMAASIMSAPAALLFGKLMVPETETPETLGRVEVNVERESVNLIDAAGLGAAAGLKLALNVGAMLLAFIALLALADLILVSVYSLPVAVIFGGEVAADFHASNPEWLQLRAILGYLFTPLAWLLGVTDWGEAAMVGQLLGTKLITNEFVAFLDLASMTGLSDRSRLIATYALCGFANVGSIGILVGGLSVIAPERRPDLSRLALRAMFAGAFAAKSTACVAAIIL